MTATRISLHLAAAAFIGAGMFGPPHIAVRQVTPGMSAPAGAVLIVEASHHDATESINVVGRAEGIRDGKRVTLPLQLASSARGKFTVTRQWQAGSPWLVVLTAEEGPGGAHAVAEAMVKIDANGSVASIDYPSPGWEAKTNTPHRTPAREIDAMLTAMAAKR